LEAYENQQFVSVFFQWFKREETAVIASESDYKMQWGQLFVPRAPIMALTGYYRRNVLDKLQMKATYTIDSYSYKNRLGLSSTLGKFNLYVGRQSFLEYRDLANNILSIWI
jgi:hypothetical protein